MTPTSLSPQQCQRPQFAVAEEQVGQIAALIGREPERVLDLACGPGRHTLPMLRRFRHSYHAQIPADRIESGFLEFFVIATDESAATAHWPAGATEGRSWTASVTN